MPPLLEELQSLLESSRAAQFGSTPLPRVHSARDTGRFFEFNSVVGFAARHRDHNVRLRRGVIPG